MTRLRFTILLLLGVIFGIDTQEITIKNATVYVADIIDGYNVVNSFLYPSSQKFKQTLPADFYVQRSKQLSVVTTPQPTVMSQPTIANQIKFQQTVNFQDVNHKLKINPIEVPLPIIAEYLATKQIYANAQQKKVSQIPQNTQNKLPSVAKPANQQKNKQTEYKKIKWNIGKLPDLSPSILENGKEILLDKAKMSSQLGNAVLQVEGQIVPLPENIQQIQDNQSSNTQTTSKPIQIIPKPSEKETERQIQIQKYKTHKWSLIIIVVIVVILFIVFLIMQCQQKKPTKVWQNFNSKLDRYRNSSAVALEQQEYNPSRYKETEETELTQQEEW